MDETLPAGEAAGSAAGVRLRAAREAAGMSLDDVAKRTRVPLRQLESIENGRYADLPSATYAVGFAKAYARVVGADEVAIGAAVRDEIGRFGVRQNDYVPYELPDPARVPSRGLVIVAAGAAVAVLILLALWYGTGLFHGGEGGATPAAEPTIAAAPTVAPTPASTAAIPAAGGGQVRLTATDEVWLRVYDADDKTLFLGTMKPGDHFDVPAGVRGPMINVGRPDKLAVTLDGKPVPPLGEGDHAIKDIKVSGAAIAARLTGSPEPDPSPSSSSSPGTKEVAAHRRDHGEGDRPHRAHLDATQRANIEAAAHPPAATDSAR